MTCSLVQQNSVRRIEDVGAHFRDAVIGVGPGRADIGGVVEERGARNGADIFAGRIFGIDVLGERDRAGPGLAFARRIVATIAGEGELAAIAAIVGALVAHAAERAGIFAGAGAVDD